MQMNYPLITVRRSEGNAATVEVRQEHFLVDRDDEPVDTPGSIIYG